MSTKTWNRRAVNGAAPRIVHDTSDPPSRGTMTNSPRLSVANGAVNTRRIAIFEGGVASTSSIRPVPTSALPDHA